MSLSYLTVSKKTKVVNKVTDKGRVDQKVRVYDKVCSYCLTEYGWCW